MPFWYFCVLFYCLFFPPTSSARNIQQSAISCNLLTSNGAFFVHHFQLFLCVVRPLLIHLYSITGGCAVCIVSDGTENCSNIFFCLNGPPMVTNVSCYFVLHIFPSCAAFLLFIYIYSNEKINFFCVCMAIRNVSSNSRKYVYFILFFISFQ